MARFSERTGWERESNEFALAVEGARAAGRELLDLTVSNPTRCGFEYPAEWFSGAGEAAGRYEPEPCGMATAREAVSGYYREMGVEVSAEQVVLTASTSEAYSFLFRVLCDAGDEVLAARPSYPLFDFLAGLEDVRLVEYPLDYDYGRRAGKANSGNSVWHIDLGELERRVTARTRAVVVVHPNNPTGNYVGAKERAALEEMCRRLGLALIVDEVFLDFAVGEPEANAGPSASLRSAQDDTAVRSPPMSPNARDMGHPEVAVRVRSAQDGTAVGSPPMSPNARDMGHPEAAVRGTSASFAGGSEGVLSFVLSGVSKVCALPQMKVSWMVVCGPEEVRREALGRLEVVADTFLSVSTPAQWMLPVWLAGRGGVQRQVRERMALNLAAAREAGLEVLQVEGGWTAVVRFADWRRALDAGVMVQPGTFYGLGDGRVVVSLITPAKVFRTGVEMLAGL